LEQHSVSEKANDNTYPLNMIKITPALALFYRDTPLNNIFHGSEISMNKTPSLGNSS